MSYIQDPNDKTKQIPRGLNNPKIFSQATAPAEDILTKNPSYIIINTSGSFSFLYTHTGSLGTKIAPQWSAWTTGSVVGNNTATRLDIQPTAWHRNDMSGSIGQVTFIYRGN